MIQAQEALKLSKSELKLITEIFTGHGPVYYHLHNIGRARSPLCRHCGGEVETTEHVIKTCAAGGPSRMLKFGKSQLQDDDLGSAPLRALTKIYREHLGQSSYKLH